MVEPERVYELNGRAVRPDGRYVLYWMQAAQRARDNPALSYASGLADGLGLPLAVVFVLAEYPDADRAHYAWMLAGLRETAAELRKAGMAFAIARGEPRDLVAVAATQAAALVFDFSPSRWPRSRREALAAALPFACVEVDGESLIPTRIASPKQEWSARTFRMKVTGAIGQYAGAAPLPVPRPRFPASRELHDGLQVLVGGDDALLDAHGPYPAPYPPSGPAAAAAALRAFADARLSSYDDARNDPNRDGCSGLSPYLHFGQLSPVAAARAALEAGEAAIGGGAAAFVEQLVVRRELCRNYAWYRPDDYERWGGLPEWSRRSLLAHAADRRAYVYGPEAFEAAKTHDRYWNAAQRQLMRTGTMHNYMRMYWGKMILAWSRDPREAFATAVYLNDRYALDGRDPDGWAGVGWCFGLHDRPWPERPVFGTVRAMAASGLKRKFDPEAYARRWLTDEFAF